jgi:alpha-L-fucosidase
MRDTKRWLRRLTWRCLISVRNATGIFMNRRTWILASLASLLTGWQPVCAQRATYVPTQSNLDARQWFQDAKFGKPGLAEWIMNDAQIPAKNYERLASFFNPSRFDADAWVKNFRAAGAKYIVITSKHHDGFAMFRSLVSPYNVVDSTPFARDPIAELSAACQRHGIKLFFYYSQLDWHSPDYYPRGATGHFAGRPESGSWDRYIQYQNAQLRELMTNYGPIGGIWFDGWWDQQGRAIQERWGLESTYRMIHELQPATLIVNNHHQAPFPGEDYQTFERDLPGENAMGFNSTSTSSLPLEMSETMNGTWGFSLTDDHYKTTAALIRTMVSAAGRGANFLLNTGPMPNGEIQPENLKTLAEIGAWLTVNGRSIYGTRAGPVAPRAWGVMTRRAGLIYVHILNWEDERLFVPIESRIKRASNLSGGTVPMKTVSGGIELTVPKAEAGVWDRIIVLQQ